MISSRFRLGTQNLARPSPTNNAVPVTAATKLLQSSGMSMSAQPPNPDTNIINGDTSKESASFPLNHHHHPYTVGGNDSDEKDVTRALAKIPTSTGSDSITTTVTCTTSHPISVQNSKAPRSIPDIRSSLPEVDALSTLSTTRLPAERSCTVGDVIGFDSSKFSPSPFSRSLNFPLSSCEQSSLLHLHTLKAASEKPPSALSKPFANNSAKVGGSLCLPPLPCSKLGAADSRRGRKVLSHQEEVHTLKLLHNHHLQWRFANAKAEASIHAQRWETERKLYSLGVDISSLHDTVKRNRIELGLLKQAKTLSTIIEAHAEEMDALISELARVIGGERAFVEECGLLLFKTYTSQVEELSLRGHLIQLQQGNHHQLQEE
ncbi:hypothetical protein HYC85_017502 [Camellia sinensis]|uniref:Uncharacterized protein n=1 Tax=Camellia sinensis TaxID=4442 RepID=A0A7J7GTB2_CAMSI|nr:hypothetical protein HYC85_017502 [Camellia sinensis]